MPQHRHVPGPQVVTGHRGGQSGQSQARVEATGGQRRHGAGRVADQQSLGTDEPAEHPTDRDRTAATPHRAGRRRHAAEAGAEGSHQPRQRAGQPIRLPREPDMSVLPVVGDPGEIAGGQARIHHAVQRRRCRTAATG